ncbi:MAG: hypothetical protein ACRDOT_05675 [Aeromicrobium sp.]
MISKDLSGDSTISKAFMDWCKRNHVTVPSKVEMAYQALRNEQLQLTAKGARALRDRHVKFMAALGAPNPEG